MLVQFERVFVFLHLRWNVLCCTYIGYPCMHAWNQGGRVLSLNSMCPVLPQQNSNRGVSVCVHMSTAENGSCSGGILICQVGLVKSSTGREGDGRGPALTCFRHEGDKKNWWLSSKASPSQAVEYTSWATSLSCWEPTFLHRHLHCSLKISFGILEGNVTPHVEEKSEGYPVGLEMLGEM